RRPLRSRHMRLMSGKVTIIAAGSFSYDAMAICSFLTRNRKILPRSRISAGVIGTKFQFVDQASLKISMTIAMSRAKCRLEKGLTTSLPDLRLLSIMDWIAGGTGVLE